MTRSLLSSANSTDFPTELLVATTCERCVKRFQGYSRACAHTHTTLSEQLVTGNWKVESRTNYNYDRTKWIHTMVNEWTHKNAQWFIHQKERTYSSSCACKVWDRPKTGELYFNLNHLFRCSVLVGWAVGAESHRGVALHDMEIL